MFRPGQVLKVKVEIGPDRVGFGRATIVQTDSSKIFLRLKTSKGTKTVLPKGAKIWFVSDTTANPFNGLWSSRIVSAKSIHGKPALECSRPKFEAIVQKRKQRRTIYRCPVRVRGDMARDLTGVFTRNLSRSGIGLETAEDTLSKFQHGHHIDVVLESAVGDIELTARVVQARYNWIANRTEAGLEIVKIDVEGVQKLDNLLRQLGGKTRQQDACDPDSEKIKGSLSGWLKSSRENVTFIKSKQHELAAAVRQGCDQIEDLEEENFEELDDLEDAEDIEVEDKGTEDNEQ